jgi:hypothetical protein
VKEIHDLQRFLRMLEDITLLKAGARKLPSHPVGHVLEAELAVH